MSYLYDLAKEVQYRWMRYQHEASLERFLAVRDAVASSVAYEVDALDLDGAERLLKDGSVADGEVLLRTLMPNGLLTPRVHLLAATHFEKNHQKNSADRELFLGQSVRAGLLRSGTGSETYPYRILHAEDAREVLTQLKKIPREERQSHLDGRSFLRFDCADDSTVCFEIPEHHLLGG